MKTQGKKNNLSYNKRLNIYITCHFYQKTAAGVDCIILEIIPSLNLFGGCLMLSGDGP